MAQLSGKLAFALGVQKLVGPGKDTTAGDFGIGSTKKKKIVNASCSGKKQIYRGFRPNPRPAGGGNAKSSLPLPNAEAARSVGLRGPRPHVFFRVRPTKVSLL